MTIFITEFFKLDLSHLNIKFSEENTFFEKDLIKQYSFPFKIPKERSFIPLYEFVRSHNSVNSNSYIEGLLFHNDKYYEAEMLLLSISKTIESVFYYSFDKLTIFDKKLTSLPWETIEITDSIHEYAEQTVIKDYPETLINFPKIYAPELYKDYEFGQHIDYINDNVDESFSETFPNPYNLPDYLVYKMNEIRPFMYLKEIVKFIFNQIDYDIIGDFITNTSIDKCLLYHVNSIFYTNNDYTRNENINLTLNQSNLSGYNPSYLTYNEYRKTTAMSSYGTYSVKLNIEGTIPAYNGGSVYIRCYFNGNLLRSAAANSSLDNTEVSFNRSLEFSFDVPKNLAGSLLEVKVICVASVESSITGEYEIKGTLRPLYKNFISLKDLLPDVTVGEFISGVKETFNMTSVFYPSTQTVKFDFFDSFVNNQDALNLSKYAIDSVPRKFNKSVGFKMVFSDGENININKTGDFISSQVGFTEKHIPIQPLSTTYINAQPNVIHQEGLSLLFFKSNADARPLIVDGDIAYNRLGFIHTFLRNWYYQSLNSEEYNVTVYLPLFLSSKLNAESKVWFYNNYFLVHNLKRQNINSLFEKVSLRLFKLKSFPAFNLVIDGGSGNTEILPPEIITATRVPNYTTIPVSYTYTQTTNFIGNLSDGGYFGWDPIYVTSTIYANTSTDPQGLELSFGWELLSSPNGISNAQFISQNGNSSIITFKKVVGYVDVVGDYIIRLTVTNSYGVSNTLDITVAVG